MIKKVKNWLGIEGVKLELELPEAIGFNASPLKGKVVFYSKTEQEVTGLTIKLVERYARGRGETKKIDEYVCGKIDLDNGMKIPSEQPIALDFSLPFEILKSDMDRYANKGFVFKGLVNIAKWASSVSSQYFVIAEAQVKGVALDPFSKKTIEIT